MATLIGSEGSQERISSVLVITYVHTVLGPVTSTLTSDGRSLKYAASANAATEATATAVQLIARMAATQDR